MLDTWCKLTPMRDAPEYTTMKVWTRTLRKLRMLAAARGERLVQLLDRLADEEAEREHQAGSETMDKSTVGKAC